MNIQFSIITVLSMWLHVLIEKFVCLSKLMSSTAGVLGQCKTYVKELWATKIHRSLQKFSFFKNLFVKCKLGFMYKIQLNYQRALPCLNKRILLKQSLTVYFKPKSLNNFSDYCICTVFCSLFI